jgi:uncharacterized protein
MSYVRPTEDEVHALLRKARTIAVVGASSKPDRPSNRVMRILIAAGYDVIPVNPRETEVLGLEAYPSLAAVPEPIDIVDVFRRAEETPAIAREAVRVGAKTLWLQLGVINQEAASLASAAGLSVVMDRCLGDSVQSFGIEHHRAGAPS